jgi:signal peptidase II
MPPKLKVFLGAGLGTLALDQLSKEWVIRTLFYGDHRTVIDGFFYLTHVRNPGAAFSLFATTPEPYRKIFFLTTGVLALAMVFSFYRQLAPGERLSALALGSILGGACGNLLDRVRHGEVIDWIRFELWSGYQWPDFNFADSFIVIGVGLLILELFASEGEELAAPRGSDDAPGVIEGS